VALAFKRVANILEGVDYKNKVDTARFEAPQEKDLHTECKEIAGKFAVSITEGNYTDALAALIKLRTPVDALFDHCMIMAEDKQVRVNRLALLGEIARLFSQIADFSQLGGGEEG
jgi:glycyl-tRNA synthetase beta chain